MFIQGNYIHWTLLRSRTQQKYLFKNVPSHFMIIINFTITISWIKYSYNSFRLKDEEIADLIEGSVLYISASDTISSPKSNMPASEQFISKGTVENTLTVSSCSRYTTFLLFGSRFHRQTYLYPMLSAIYALTISDRGQGSLNADVS